MRVCLISLPLLQFIWNFALSADPKVSMLDTWPVTRVIEKQKSIVVEKDHDVYMACKATNKPKMTPLQWMAQMYDTSVSIPISTNTDIQDPFKYAIDKPAGNLYRLKIHSAQLSDEGYFVCRIQLNNFQYANDSRRLIVIQKPQILDIKTSSDMVLEEGDRATLRCQADGIPPPLMSWERAGGGTLPHGGLELVSPNLVIDSVDRTHHGIYKCIAKNTAGTDVRRIQLNVKFHPRVIAKTSVVFQAQGYDRELKCEAAGNPVPTNAELMWFKDGSPIVAGDKYDMETYMGSNYVLMKLRVKRIEDSDYGQYSCYAENPTGNGENVVTLSKTDVYVSDMRMARSRADTMVNNVVLVAVLFLTSLTSYS